MKYFLRTVLVTATLLRTVVAGPATTTVGGTATNEPTVVTSDRMQTDYAGSVSTFIGNVVVVDRASHCAPTRWSCTSAAPITLSTA